MKKEYLSPEMEVVNIQTMSVLAQSLPQGEGEKPAEQADAPSWFGGDDQDW